MGKILEIRHLIKSFGGIRAVNDLNFTLAPGELLALIGPNGAGKSTCFNLINGQLTPDSGFINILGEKTNGQKPRQIWRLGVGRTFQITATFMSMTVIENVQMALISLYKKTRHLIQTVRQLYRSEAIELLELVGMAQKSESICGTLAYGELKRVELAVALANAPKLLLMDEPTAGLGSKERTELMALTAAIVHDRQIGALFTEHDMEVVFGHADHILVLHEGKLIAQGKPDEIRQNSAVQKIYLGNDTTSIYIKPLSSTPLEPTGKC